MNYVKLNHAEQVFGEKNLLYTQMELLNLIKHYRNYIKLRKEEQALKKLLKKSVKEMHNEVDTLYKALPKTKTTEEMKETQKRRKKRTELEEQIQDIKERISKIH